MELHKYNPIVILLYFISNILITMITKNPVFIMVSFLSVIIYSLILKFPNRLYQYIIFIMLIITLATITNPFFSTLGDTILFQIGKTNFSFEEMFYGFITSIMLISLILWFRNYNLLMTSDKFLYLFSGYFPNLALIISMVLKMIPDLLIKVKDIDAAEKVLGNYAKVGLGQRLKNKFLVLGNVFSYSIVYSLETATSMKARGYGLKGKTHYIKYQFKVRDFLVSLMIVSFTTLIFILNSSNLLEYSFYPILSPISFDHNSIVSYSLFFVLANLATFLHVKEKIKWHYLKLKIYHSPTV